MRPLQAGDPARVGRYQVLARLGAGGMGVVYLARSPGARLAALKLVRREFADDAGFRERFRREIAAASTVSGVYTAPVLDSDADAPQPWYAAAYVPAPALNEAIGSVGPLPEPAVRALGAGLAEALRAIHAAGLVHRDLKPGNILLAEDGPRIIDFGIAKATDATRITRTGAMIGTLAYMAPSRSPRAGTPDPRRTCSRWRACWSTRPPAPGRSASATPPRCSTRSCTRNRASTACPRHCAKYSPPAWPRSPPDAPRWTPSSQH
ncbi:serine/threonine-protein kinase [Actinomadura sp. WMMB 499]|uniref:serine/threonine-protein kinase n=1 Tax=Actinomadura sp. WMMB 499 TaxID=1219491 RepID=UPI001245697B|nr:serine/threonine-protein kinase [Actinomadura sp. WMMB 499]QFG22781.1 serine/threonine protein kinase [Actinomadura sp. WMMB 499]